VRQLVRGVLSGYGRHALPQFAAAIAYRVLFSLVPLVAVVVSILQLVLPENTRQDVTDWLLGVVPGPEEIDASIERAVSGSRLTPSAVGVIALIGLLWGASGMMASIRAAFRVIWEGDIRRPYVRGKLLDLLLVLLAGLVVVVAFGATLFVEVVAELGRDVSGLTGVGSDGRTAALVAQAFASLAVTFGVFAVLYRIVPPRPPAFRALWPGALLGALGFHLATTAYGFYLARFGNFDAVYGSLGAVLGFLVVVYVGALVLLLGAELVAVSSFSGEEDRAARQ
jgi:membrane protein